MRFSDLGLSEPILHALGDCGYDEPTPIQEKSIPIVAEGHDLIASAQTGTGKTAAFTLAIIDDIGSRPAGKGDTPLVLILTPTRELAQQIDENIREYGKYVNTRSVVVVGGVSSAQQINKIRQGVDFVVATPGRLIDLVEQRELDLRDVEFFILDEADRMLDMGFVHDVRRISDWVPRPRQTLLFSATMTSQVASLASTVQTNALTVSVAPPATVADNIDQRVMYVDKADKPDLLLDLLRHVDTEHTLVFTGTRVAAAMVTRHLEVNGVKASAIHSDKSQSQRQRALEAFTKGKIRVLVATDIVARGIDVDGISHVINYELPDDAENYIHRIGRTARAGRAGVAVSLCCINDVPQLRGVENLLKKPLEVIEEHDYHSPTVMACVSASAKAARSRARAGKGRSSGSKWAR